MPHVGSTSKGKLAGRILALIVTAAALSAPAIFAAKSIAKTAAMLAIALIFLNIMTGSLALPLYRLFGYRQVYYFHIVTGAGGFLLAVVHMLWILAAVNIYRYSSVWLIGPVALGLMALTIPTAIYRKRVGALWRRIHQMNYAIFAALLLKAFWIGSNTSAMVELRLIWYIYGTLAAAGVAYRVWRWRQRKHKGGKSAIKASEARGAG
ncbi:MAG: hypothetical protein ACYC55_04315 [Candidatus Geothermincolia bacterium]